MKAKIWRWFSADAIQPWRHRTKIFPPDPDFELKATRVLDLYARHFEGNLLGRRDYVISADEKTSVQARGRRHPPSLPAASGPGASSTSTAGAVALAYFAAWDVDQAKVFGRCEPTTGIEPCGRLVDQVMGREPYGSARQVYWVVDNGSSHRGQAAGARLQRRWPNALLVHLPVHALWLNQIWDLLLSCPAQGSHPQRLR